MTLTHGTNAGYLYGCRQECCRTAHATYRRSVWRKRYARGVDRLYIDATGTQRRIRALQRMGWRFIDIDRALGRNPKAQNATIVHNIGTQARVHIDTADAIATIYDRLSMTPGPSELLRKRAAAKGWPAPLSWDDDTIDDPNAEPNTGEAGDIDPVVINRILAGENLPSTRAERTEVIRRWVADGRPTRELNARLGWKIERYWKNGQAA
jgi:hypothetical protein